MQAGGSHPDEAQTIARRLVDSNLVGHDSHGVLRVGKYLEWVRDGWLKPNTAPTIVFDSDTIAIIDGNRGFGQVTGEFATSLGIAKAARKGIAMIGLRNCGHLGRLGDWARWRRRRAGVTACSIHRARSVRPRRRDRRLYHRRWRSACRSKEAIRRSLISRRRPWPRAS
jgi:uncharacterized oxidoreductase